MRYAPASNLCSSFQTFFRWSVPAGIPRNFCRCRSLSQRGFSVKQWVKFSLFRINYLQIWLSLIRLYRNEPVKQGRSRELETFAGFLRWRDQRGKATQ